MIVARPLKDTTYATATCDTSDAVGDLVYIAGNLSGGDYQAAKADPINNKMPAIAVIVAKLSPTKAVVQFEGNVKGVYTGLTAGKTYYVDSTGKPSLTPPSPSLGGKAYVQPVGVAVDTNILRLQVSHQLIVLRG